MFKKKIFLLILLSTPGAMAQTSMWGAGVYGGMQGCAYPRTAGSGAQDGNDEIKEIQQNIQDMQKQKKQKQTEASRLEKREMKESLAAINDVLSSGYADFVIDHIDNGRSCVEYSGVGNPGDVVANGSDGGSAVQSPGQTPTKPFPPDEWSKLCDRDKPGAVSGSVCVTAKYRAEEKGTHTIDECKKALVDYRKQKQQKDRLMKEIASLDRDLERAKDRLKDAREDAAQAKRDGPSGVDTDTEGGVCLKCLAAANGYTYQQPQTDWGNVLTNIGTGALATYLGYKSQQAVIDANSNLGYPTQQTYPAWGYGLPYFAQGIYGAIGGGTGQGAFGCGGGQAGVGGMAGVGGAFGYPQNMMNMNTLGGGLFTSGMGPWGMNGMGNMMGNMMGSSMNPMMSMMGSMGNGYGNNMFGLNGMMGNNMLGMNGMMGLNNMMGLNGMMGNNSLLGNSNMYQLQMQYQQQAMQMQMQYYQQYQQQQLQRYQSVSSLQQEIYSLIYKMQSIQNGYGSTTGYLGASSSLTSTGYSTVPVGGLTTTGYSSYYSPIPVTTTINGSGR